MEVDFKPINRIWERVEEARSQNDSALFDQLLNTAEVATKTAVSGLVACIEDHKERHRYRHKYRLVRADGLGTWAGEVNKILTGPTAGALNEGAYEESRQLTERTEDNDDWQYRAVESMHASLDVMYPECQSMPRSVKGLLWFQYLAELRNKSDAHAAPTDVQYTDASLYLEEAVRLFVENLKIFSRPWAHLSRNQSGKWNVTKIGGNRKEYEELWSSRDVSLQSNSGVYLKLNDEYKYVDLLKSDSTARKVYLPNGGYNENKYELICFYTNERKFGDAEDYITPPDRLPESETKGGETLEVMGETFSNLPKPPRHYVRREQLEQELADKLTNTERYPIVTLWGMGGIGKTSLALKVLTEISKKGIYEAIFWFSARDIDLTSEGPKSVSPEVVTKKDIAKKFKKIYPTSKKIDDDLSFIEDNLTNKRLEKPSLFVFDNFETVRNPKEIYLWIDTFIRNPNKVVITTRENRFPASFPIEVGSMSDQEALALIQDTVNTLGIADKIDESAAQEIADSSKGHPYVIKVLLGEIAKGSSTSQFRNIVASKEDVLTALFERTWKNLSPLARRAFLTLCSWKSIVPKLSLQAVLMRNIDEAIDVDAALQELKTSSLIETVESESDGKKFIDVPLAASVFGEQKLKVSSHKTAVEADADLLYKFGAMQRSDIPKGVEPRIKRFISNLFNIIKSLENYRHNYSNMLKHIARNHPPAWKHLADHINRLEGDHPEVVVEYLLQYVQTAEYSSKSIWKRIANLASKNGDVLTELTAWSEYATHSESGVEEASIAANRLNSIFHDREVDIDTDEKRVLCQKVVDELYSHDRSLTATDYSRLAWLLLHLQKVAEAETATVKGLHEDSSNKYCLNLAEQLEIDIEKITKGSRSQI